MGKNKEIDFLNLIYKVSEKEIINIDNVILDITNEKFIKILKEEKEEYENILKETENILKKSLWDISKKV